MASRVIDAENDFTGSWGDWSSELNFFNAAIPSASDLFLQVLRPEIHCDIHMPMNSYNGLNKLGCINEFFHLACLRVRVTLFAVGKKRTVDPMCVWS